MAAKKIYTNPEAVHEWNDAGSADTLITLNDLASGGSRIGGRWDRGAGAIAMRYKWRFVTRIKTTAVFMQAVDLFFATGDGTYVDGEEGTVDAAGDGNKVFNMIHAGAVVVDTTTLNVQMTTSGLVFLHDRYISPFVQNNTDDNLMNSNTHHILLTPYPAEIQ